VRIIGLSGRAGAGKDTVADILVRERGYTKIALADPLKRACRKFFAGRMTAEHLWGPSEKRNEPIPELGGLTARKALQTLGTEWGRACYPDVWVDLCLATITDLQSLWENCGWFPYYAQYGILREDRYICEIRPNPLFVISDVRFLNELEAIRAAGGEVWRVIRGSEDGGLQGEAATHVSETELSHDSGFAVHLSNEGSIEHLQALVLALEARSG
jgi:hypothetical protein